MTIPGLRRELQFDGTLLWRLFHSGVLGMIAWGIWFSGQYKATKDDADAQQTKDIAALVSAEQTDRTMIGALNDAVAALRGASVASQAATNSRIDDIQGMIRTLVQESQQTRWGGPIMETPEFPRAPVPNNPGP